MARRYYSSTAARTTLASGVDDSTTTFTVVAVSGWPDSFPYTLIIDQDTINEEVVSVTNRSGTTLTVSRAQDGTSAVSHSAGAAVNHGVSARDFNEPNQFLNEGGTVTGQTVVSSSGSGTTLEVRNTGSGNSFVVEDSANPDATPFVVDASGRVFLGQTSSLNVGSVINRSLQVFSSATTNGAAGATFVRGTNDTSGPIISFGKSRATTAGSFSIVSDGDLLGAVVFAGDDGTDYQTVGAQIVASVDGTPGTNDMPGRLVFSTTADGASTPTERMRITSAGNVGIGTSSPSTKFAVVTGTTAFVISPVDGSITYVGNASDHPVATLVNNTERMRISSAGLITGSGTSLGAWTAYTPTLGGTGWDIGNGTATGYYCQIGKVVHTVVYIVFGSTSTFGSGGLTVTLPSNRISGTHYTLNGYLRDSSLAAYYPVIAPTIQAGYVYLVNTASNNGVIDGTPFTFASGDILSLSGTYQIA